MVRGGEQTLRLGGLQLQQRERLPDGGAGEVPLGRLRITRIAGIVVVHAQEGLAVVDGAFDEHGRIARQQQACAAAAGAGELDHAIGVVGGARGDEPAVPGRVIERLPVLAQHARDLAHLRVPGAQDEDGVALDQGSMWPVAPYTMPET